jgi:Mu transposase, C-terminal domain
VKKDAEVRLLLRERQHGRTQAVAAARAGMSERTARKYEHTGALPSQLKRPRTWRTRPDPFAEVWPWLRAELERDPALQATTLLGLLCARDPARYRPGQLRTLQRHVAAWRALHGPEREVVFEQRHPPGERAQSDFTHMDDLAVTLGGAPFPHLVFHLVLPYSNWEAVRVCFTESFEALAEGLEHGLWRLGGVPRAHQTDQLTAAVQRLDAAGRHDWTRRYAALLGHYGLAPATIGVRQPHQNGDVEQAHFRFKQAVDQALRVRGSRDFAGRPAYEAFLDDLVRQRNQTRHARLAAERRALRPLPAAPLAPSREVRATVSRFGTVHVLGNTYSVPSRLVGTTLTVRVRAETWEGYVGTALALTVPRLAGRGGHAVDYRHVVWSLVRKPGAFAAYRYRDDLFPTLAFRRAYDRLRAAHPARPDRADREYVRVLSLAASTSEADVEAALTLLLESGAPPAFDAVRDLVRPPRPPVPALPPPVLDLAAYDRLLPSHGAGPAPAAVAEAGRG